MAHDALKQPIEIGKKYGYTSKDGGWNRVVVGVAKKISDTGRVTIEVESVTTYLYNKIAEGWTGSAPSTSVASFLLFPVNG